MNAMTKLKEDLVGYLKEQPGLENADILIAWPSKRHMPLKAPAITVGLEGVDLTPAGLGAYLGRDGQSADLYGCAALITMRFDFFAPARESDYAPSGGLHELYESLCAALSQSAGNLGVTRVWCDAPGWDEAANANRLTARASLRVALPIQEAPGKAEQSRKFSDFTLIRS